MKKLRYYVVYVYDGVDRPIFNYTNVEVELKYNDDRSIDAILRSRIFELDPFLKGKNLCIINWKKLDKYEEFRD